MKNETQAQAKRRVLRAIFTPRERIPLSRLRSLSMNAVHPRSDHDVEVPEDCWERAGKRIRQMDPDRSRARKIFRELVESTDRKKLREDVLGSLGRLNRKISSRIGKHPPRSPVGKVYRKWGKKFGQLEDSVREDMKL